MLFILVGAQAFRRETADRDARLEAERVRQAEAALYVTSLPSVRACVWRWCL